MGKKIIKFGGTENIDINKIVVSNKVLNISSAIMMLKKIDRYAYFFQK